MDPTENFAIGFYLLIIGIFLWSSSCLTPMTRYQDFSDGSYYVAVFVSFFFNLLVIVVITLRRKKLESTDVFIIALAVSDMMFSLAIHPMLIATSFGANSFSVFTPSGQEVLKLRVRKLYVLMWFSLS